MKILKLTAVAMMAVAFASCGSKESTSAASVEAAEVESAMLVAEAEAPATDGEDAVAESSDSADIDALLNEYESFMDQYVKYVKKAMSGDMSMSVLAEAESLEKKADSLGEKLRKMEGQMTPEQASRFAKIAAKASQAIM